LSFTPDGALLLIPTGIHSNPLLEASPTTGKKQSIDPQVKSFCTHVFHREQLLSLAPSVPIMSLIGLDSPSVAVRVCPRLFKLMKSTEDEEALIVGEYRYIVDYYFSSLNWVTHVGYTE
jgi:hypothetical protein